MSQAQVLLLDENRGFGGAERHAVSLAQELERRGLLVGLGARKDSWLYSNSGELPVASVGFRNEVDMFSVFALYKLIKSRQVNVIHCIAHRDLVSAALARQLPGAPPLVLVKAEHSFPDPDLSPLFRWAYRQCDAVVCVSEALKERVVATLEQGEDWGGEFAVIPNGISTAAPPGVVSASSDLLRVGVLSALRPGKGQADVLQALVRLSPPLRERIELSMAGDGPLAKELAEQARGLGLQVEFLGHVEQPASYLAGLDLCVLPSHVETFSLVALECLCLGVPLLAARSAGVMELYPDETMTYPIGDSEVLAEKLMVCLESAARNVARAQELALAYRQGFSLETMGARYQELYERLLQQSQERLVSL